MTEVKDLTKLTQDIYDDVYYNEILRKDEEAILNEDILEYATEDRKIPKYAKGFLDKPFMQGGKPVREKDLKLYNAILSGNYTLIEIEGGVRGGKDVIALLAWSRFLQVSPDLVHMALGSSLEHVLRTVLMSNGFGLYYTLPHGIFIRESVSGAQRGAYKFIDNYGREKTILFYGNDKENDNEKFQGFTLGSIYVNETLNQHIRGLEQGLNRISAALQPLMIMTQNPKGSSNDYYQVFELPKLANEHQIKQLEFIRDTYKEHFELLENKIKKDRDKERREIIKTFLQHKGVASYKYLDDKEQISLNELLLECNFKYDKIIRNIPVQSFYSYINENDYLYGKSMKKVVAYEKGDENVNGIFNAYDFFYSHYTIDDNMSMTEMSRNDFKNKRAKGTATYDQEVLGKRRSTEGAVYSSFNASVKDGNIFEGDLNQFDWTSKVRAIVIDPGFNHPTGMTDWAVDLNRGMAWQLQERKIDFNKEYMDNKSLDVIASELWKLVRNLKGRSMPEFVIVDPSKPELITFLQSLGFSVISADNTTWATRQKEKEASMDLQSRELRGIPLVQTAYGLRKIFHHITCVETIEQVSSYSYQKTKDGKDKLQDLHDDLVDTVKYLFNTLNIRPSLWKEVEQRGEEINEKIDEETVQRFSVEEIIKRRVERQSSEIYNGRIQREDESDSFFYNNGLWN